ncbi:plasma-membrane proton-efflux P-type ATPase [Hydrogenimonas sp.]
MSDETNMANLHSLTSEEAKKRLQEYGPNSVEEKEEGWLSRLFKRFWGPIPWMIEVAAILSAVVRRWEDFTIIVILLFVNAIVDFYQESKALSAIRVLKKKLARKALVLRDGKWQQIPAAEIVPGDVIKIKIGDIVPADAKLAGGGDFIQLDQSALTGESLPVNKKVGEEVYANAVVKQGEMIAVVTKTGKNTYFGKTVALVAKAEREQKSHFQKMVISVGNFLIAVTLVMIAIIIYVGVSRHEPTIELLVFSLVLTISAIPVAMPAVLTVTMAVGARVLAAKNAVVSRLAAIEELAGMDVLCSDKTGTLTKNEMTLAEPYVLGGFRGDDLFFYAALASREENHDPIEKPIFDHLEHHALKEKLKGYEIAKFIPFDPVRKRTEAIVERNGKCDFIVTKGAPQVVLTMSDLKEDVRKEVERKIDEFAQKGFRTLGVAYKKCDEEHFTFVGLIPLYDPPREDSKDAIQEAARYGVTVKMVTGDNIAVARYIAKILGIGDNILDIRELRGESAKEYLLLSKLLAKAFTKVLYPQMSREDIERVVHKIVAEVQDELMHVDLPSGTVKKHESEIIKLIEQADGFAQVFPEDKYFIVDELQKSDHIVGMTGDGVNDAPALKKADCGIAVSGATDAARAAADIVLMAPGLRVIVDALELSRITFERMKSYTVYRIAETIRIVVFMTLAITIFEFYPITSVMIILLALLNDLPILMIATDNTKLNKKPVRWRMKEILVLSSWLGVAGVFSSFLLFYIAMTVMHLPEGYVQTMFFVKMVVAGHNTIFNTRTDEWFFKKPWPSGKLFWTSQFTAIAGTIIGIYGFGLMQPIGWFMGLFLWAYAIVWFVFNDAVKVAIVNFYRKKEGIDIL